MRKGSKLLLYLLALLMLLSFAMKFDAVAGPVAQTLGKPVEAVKDIATLVFFTSVGLFLVYAGALSMAVPVIGGALILVGVALVAATFWNHFKKPKSVE